MKTKLVYHHSAIANIHPQYNIVREYHERKWPKMKHTAYHVFVERDGTVIWNPEGLDSILYHAGQHNESAIGVCFAGHFGQELMTKEQVNALVAVTNTIRREYAVELYNHRELRPTSCPQIDIRDIYLKEKNKLPPHGNYSMLYRTLQRAIARSRGKVRAMQVRRLERLKTRHANLDCCAGQS